MNHRKSNHHIIWLLIIVLITIIPSACATNQLMEASQPIASYPRQTPIAVAPPLPEQGILVYRAYLEMQVGNVERISSQVQELSYRYGGYLVSTQSWYVDENMNTSMVLAVPTANFEGLYHELRMLGNPISENISTEIVQTYPRGLVPYSHITLHLRPYPSKLPGIYIHSSWDPVRTFRNASGVFVRIFGFLADVLIWLLVVVGPFVLILWLGVLVIRRMRRATHSNKTE